MNPLRVVFAGTPEVAVPALRAVYNSAHTVVAVLTKPDARAGRGRTLQPSAVSREARELGLPVMTPVSLIDSAGEIAGLIDSERVDAVAVVAYGLLVPPALLDVPRFGWVNVHFSELPRWRGAAPVQHAIANGDESISVTTFRIDSGLDTGPVLMRSPHIAIEPREDSGHLLERLAPIGAELLVHTLDSLATDSVRPTPQSSEGVSLAPSLTTEHARIDWRREAHEIDNQIRGCTPAPGAWTTVDGARLRIGVPAAVHPDTGATPGQLVIDKHSVMIGGQGGFVELGVVQPHGGKQMAAADWARGLRATDPSVE